MVVVDRVGLEGEPPVLLDLVRGAQVDHGLEAERLQPGDIGLGDPVDAVGPVQRLPLRHVTIGRGVAAEVTEVERPLELDVSHRTSGCSGHGFDRIGASLTRGLRDVNAG